MNLAKTFFFFNYNNVFRVVYELSVAVWPWTMILTGGITLDWVHDLGMYVSVMENLYSQIGMILMAQ